MMRMTPLHPLRRLPELTSPKETEPPSKVCLALTSIKKDGVLFWNDSHPSSSDTTCLCLTLVGLKSLKLVVLCISVVEFVMKSISYFLVRQKRKLSDKPVEAGEDYTKFNSADFARKVSVDEGNCGPDHHLFWLYHLKLVISLCLYDLELLL